MAAHGDGRVGGRDQPLSARGDRARHPDAGGRCAVAGTRCSPAPGQTTPTSPACSPGCPPTTRCSRARSPAAGAVLGRGRQPEPTGMTLRAPPFLVRDTARRGAAPATPNLVRYAGVLTSIDELDRAASGHGLMSVDPERGVIRRIPLVASIDGTFVPALAIEMLRIAFGAPAAAAAGCRRHGAGHRDRRLRRADRERRRGSHLLFAPHGRHASSRPSTSSTAGSIRPACSGSWS